MYEAPTAEAPATAPLAALFSGLADPSRLELLRRLTRDGPQSVGELVEASGIRQPSVSKHLACLHGCGLLERERRGRVVVYSVGSDEVATLLEAGERVWEIASCGGACSCPICHEGG
jgi:DNA-binding transcriptional ArsR family regulator